MNTVRDNPISKVLSKYSTQSMSSIKNICDNVRAEWQAMWSKKMSVSQVQNCFFFQFVALNAVGSFITYIMNRTCAPYSDANLLPDTLFAAGFLFRFNGLDHHERTSCHCYVVFYYKLYIWYSLNAINRVLRDFQITWRILRATSLNSIE